MDKNEMLRQLPQVDRLAREKDFEGLSTELVKTAARRVLDRIRESRELPDIAGIKAMVADEYESIKRGTLYKVVNATGVPIHTNLGRSPLERNVLGEAFDIACGYSNLEYDIPKGKRGDRYHHAAQYLRLLTGAEDALVVNNNASAVFVILNTFAKNKEVIVSRGELVEIGGSFRIPDVMKGSGAKLAEVGTTNKTRAEDYIDAVTPKTAMMMKVHRSNFDIVGFSEDTPLESLAAAAQEAGVISYYDAGSGLFKKILPDSVCSDVTMPEVMKKGFDLVSFSGDKMLGGPQAGIIAGKKELIAKIKRNPLMRMLRVDKITLALLQAVFRSYMDGSYTELPVNKMLAETPDNLKKKADKLADMLPCPSEVISIKSTIGGGSCPLSELDSYGVAPSLKIKPQKAEKLLRAHTTPVISRVSDDKLIFDVRTVSESEFEIIQKAAEALL